MKLPDELKVLFDEICADFVDRMGQLIDPDSICIVFTKLEKDNTVKANYYMTGQPLLAMHGVSGALEQLIQQHTKDLFDVRKKSEETDEQV